MVLVAAVVVGVVSAAVASVSDVEVSADVIVPAPVSVVTGPADDPTTVVPAVLSAVLADDASPWPP